MPRSFSAASLLCWALWSPFLQQALKTLCASPEVLKSFVEEGQENTPHEHCACHLILFIKKIKPSFQLLFAFSAVTQYKGITWVFFAAASAVGISIVSGISMQEAREKGFLQLQTSYRILLTYSFYVQKHTVTLPLQTPFSQSQYVYLK